MNADPARPAELIDEDYFAPNLAKAALADPNLIVSPAQHEALVAAALSEEEDVDALPSTHAQQVPANNPTHRRLSAIAGAGVPYVFLTFIEDTSQVSMDFWGLLPEELSAALATVSEAVKQ